MKYSKSAIGLLTAQYRSVLKKCWMINVGLFALGAALLTATPAEAADPLANQIVVRTDGPIAKYGEPSTTIIGADVALSTITLTDSVIKAGLGMTSGLKARYDESGNEIASYYAKAADYTTTDDLIAGYVSKGNNDSDWYKLLNGSEQFNTLNVKGTNLTTAGGVLNIDNAARVKNTLSITDGANTGTLQLYDGTLGSASFKTNNLYIGSSTTAVDGVASTVDDVSTHANYLVTNGAVNTAISAAKTAAGVYTSADHMQDSGAIFAGKTTFTAAMDEAGKQITANASKINTLMGDDTGSVNQKIASAFTDHTTTNIVATGTDSGKLVTSGAVAAKIADAQSEAGTYTSATGMQASGKIFNGKITFTAAMDEAGAQIMANASNIATNTSDIATLNGTGAGSVDNKIINQAKDAGYTFSGTTVTKTIGAAIKDNADAIEVLNGDAAGSVNKKITDQAQSATFTDDAGTGAHTSIAGATTINAAIKNVAGAVDTNTQAITDLGKSRDTAGSIKNTVRTEAADADYDASATYSTGTIGNAIKTNADNIATHTTALADLALSDGTKPTGITVQQAIDSARTGETGKTLNVGENASEIVIGKTTTAYLDMNTAATGAGAGDVALKTNGDGISTGLAMAKDGTIKLGRLTGGTTLTNGIEISGNTIKFSGADASSTTDDASITNGALTANSATLNSLTLGSTPVTGVSTAAAISTAPAANDTLATTSAVYNTVKGVTDTLETYATKLEVFGDATHAADLGKDAATVNLGAAGSTTAINIGDNANGAGIAIANPTTGAKTASLKVKGDGGDNGVFATATGAKLGKSISSTNFDGVSFVEGTGTNTGTVTIGDSTKNVQFLNGGVTATGGIQGATLKATAATGGLNLNGTIADSIDNDGTAPTAGGKSTKILASTATVYNAMTKATTDAQAYTPAAAVDGTDADPKIFHGINKVTDALDKAGVKIQTNTGNIAANTTKLDGLKDYDNADAASVQAALSSYKTGLQTYATNAVTTGAQNATFTDSTTAHASVNGATTIKEAIWNVATAVDTNTTKLDGLVVETTDPATPVTVQNAINYAKKQAGAYTPNATVPEGVTNIYSGVTTVTGGLDAVGTAAMANTASINTLNADASNANSVKGMIKANASAATYTESTDETTIGGAIKANANKIATLNGTGTGSVDKKITDQAENATFTDSATAHTSVNGATTIGGAIQNIAGATDANTAKLAGLGDQTVVQAIAAAGTAADGKYVAKTYLDNTKSGLTVDATAGSEKVTAYAKNGEYKTSAIEVAGTTIKLGTTTNNGAAGTAFAGLTLSNDGKTATFASADTSGAAKNVVVAAGNVTADGEVKAASFKIGDNDVTSIDSGAALSYAAAAADADKKVMATDATVINTVRALATTEVKNNANAIALLNEADTEDGSVLNSIKTKASSATYTASADPTTIGGAIKANADRLNSLKSAAYVDVTTTLPEGSDLTDPTTLKVNDEQINAWVGTEGAKLATVGTTYYVIGQKLLNVHQDLMDDGANKFSIARALGGTTENDTLISKVQDLAVAAPLGDSTVGASINANTTKLAGLNAGETANPTVQDAIDYAKGQAGVYTSATGMQDSGAIFEGKTTFTAAMDEAGAQITANKARFEGFASDTQTVAQYVTANAKDAIYTPAQEETTPGAGDAVPAVTIGEAIQANADDIAELIGSGEGSIDERIAKQAKDAGYTFDSQTGAITKTIGAAIKDNADAIDVLNGDDAGSVNKKIKDQASAATYTASDDATTIGGAIKANANKLAGLKKADQSAAATVQDAIESFADASEADLANVLNGTTKFTKAKIGDDWAVTENGRKRFTIRDTTTDEAIAVLDKAGTFSLNALSDTGSQQYFEVRNGSLNLQNNGKKVMMASAADHTFALYDGEGAATVNVDLTSGNITSNGTLTLKDATVGNQTLNAAKIKQITTNQTNIGDMSQLHGSDNAMVNRDDNDNPDGAPTDIVSALNNISKSVGDVHGLKAKVAGGAYDTGSSTKYADGAGNLFAGSGTDDHLAELAASIGNRTYDSTVPYLHANESVATSLVALATNLKDVADDYVKQSYFDNGEPATGTNPGLISMGSGAKNIVIGKVNATAPDSAANIAIDTADATRSIKATVRNTENEEQTLTLDNTANAQGLEVAYNKYDNAGNPTATKKVVINKGVVTADDSLVASDTAAATSSTINSDGSATFVGANKTASIVDGTVTANKFAFDATHYATGIDNTGGVFTAAPADNYTIATTRTVYDNTTLLADATNGNYTAGSLISAMGTVDSAIGNRNYASTVPYLTANESVATSLTVLANNLKGVADNYVTKDYFNNGDTSGDATSNPNFKKISMGSGANDITIGGDNTNVVVDNAGKKITLTAAGTTTDTFTFDNTDGAVFSNVDGSTTKSVKIATGNVTADGDVIAAGSLIAGDKTGTAYAEVKSDGSATFKNGSKEVTIKNGDINADDIVSTSLSASVINGAKINGASITAGTIDFLAGGVAKSVDNAGKDVLASGTTIDEEGKELASTLTVKNTVQGAISVGAGVNYAAGTVKTAVADLDGAIADRKLYNNTKYANPGSLATDTPISLAQAIKNIDDNVYAKVGAVDFADTMHYVSSADTDLTKAIKSMDTNVFNAIGGLDNRFVTQAYFNGENGASGASSDVVMGRSASSIQIGAQNFSGTGPTGLNSGIQIDVTRSGTGSITDSTISIGTNGNSSFDGIQVSSNGTNVVIGNSAANGDKVTFAGGAVTATGAVQTTELKLAKTETGSTTPTITSADSIDNAGTVMTAAPTDGKTLASTLTVYNNIQDATVFKAAEVPATAHNYAAGDTVKQAIASLDNVAGDRQVYRSSHYANPASTDISLANAIKNLDTEVYTIANDYVKISYFNNGEPDQIDNGSGTMVDNPNAGLISMGSGSTTIQIGKVDATSGLNGIIINNTAGGDKTIKIGNNTDNVTVNGGDLTATGKVIANAVEAATSMKIGTSEATLFDNATAAITASVAGADGAEKKMANVAEVYNTVKTNAEEADYTKGGTTTTIGAAIKANTDEIAKRDVSISTAKVGNVEGVELVTVTDGTDTATTLTSTGLATFFDKKQIWLNKELGIDSGDLTGNPYHTAFNGAFNLTNDADTTMTGAIMELDSSIGNRKLYNNTQYANPGSAAGDDPIDVATAIQNMDTNIYAKMGDVNFATDPAMHYVEASDNLTDAIKHIDTKVYNEISGLDDKYVTKAYFNNGELSTGTNPGLISMGSGASQINIGKTVPAGTPTSAVLDSGLSINNTTGDVMLGQISQVGSGATAKSVVETGVNVDNATHTASLISANGQSSINAVDVNQTTIKLGMTTTDTNGNPLFSGVSINNGVMTNANPTNANKKSTVSSDAVVVTDGSSTSSMAASGMAVAGATGTTLIGAGAISASDGAGNVTGISTTGVSVTDGSSTSLVAADAMAVMKGNDSSSMSATGVTIKDNSGNSNTINKSGMTVADSQGNTAAVTTTSMSVANGSKKAEMTTDAISITDGNNTTSITAGSVTTKEVIAEKFAFNDTDYATGIDAGNDVNGGSAVVDGHTIATTATVKASVDGMVADIKKEIHGDQNDSTVPVTLGDYSDTVVVGSSSVDAVSHERTLWSGMEIDTTRDATSGDVTNREVTLAAIIDDDNGVEVDLDAANQTIELTAAGKDTNNKDSETGVKIDNKNQKITLSSTDEASENTTGIEISNKDGTIAISSANDDDHTASGLTIVNDKASGKHTIDLAYTEKDNNVTSTYGLSIDGDNQTYSLGSETATSSSGLDINANTSVYTLGKSTISGTTKTLDYGMTMDAANGVTTFAASDGEGVTMNKGDMTVTSSATVGSETGGVLSGVKLDKSGTAQASESVTVGQVKADGSLDGNGVQMKNDGSAKFSATEGAVTVEKGGVIADNNVTVGDKSGDNYIDMAKQTDGSLKATFASADGNVEIAGGNVTADNKVTANDIEAKNSIFVGDPAGEIAALYKKGLVAVKDADNQATYGSGGMWAKKKTDDGKTYAADFGGTGLSVSQLDPSDPTSVIASAGVSETGLWTQSDSKKSSYGNDGLWIGNKAETAFASLNEKALYITDGTDTSNIGLDGIYTSQNISAAGNSYVGGNSQVDGVATFGKEAGKQVVIDSGDVTADGKVKGKDLEATNSFTLAGTQVHSIDTGAAKSAPSADALATTASIYRNAEDGLYTPASGTYTTANAATINEAFEALDNIVGNFPDGLNYENHNLDNGGKATPETIVDAFNNIDATLGTIHGLAAKRGADYKGNLAEGTTVEMHLSALDDSIGDRTTITNENGSNGYAFSTDTMYVADVLTDLASQIGTAGELDAAKFNGVSKDNTVNANIAALNNTIGDVSELQETTYAQGDTIVDSIKSVDNKLGNLDTRMERAERDLKDVHHELRRGMASMAAMSALVPNSRSTGKTSLSLGTGAYSGHGAVAVGGFHYLTDNLMFNAGAAWSNSRDAVYRVGLTYSF